MTAVQDDVLALLTALAPGPVAEPDLHGRLIDDLGYTSCHRWVRTRWPG